MHDLVIRGGTVVDGTGGERFTGDVAIDGERITAVGTVEDPGMREIDAAGLIVTPGWVDIHTHYDGQATWDNVLAPSSWHGVTSILMGNCGVGFAPVREQDHDFLISLMEGVEDIPGAALAEGLTWGWETFPQYLDVLASRQFTMDIGAQIPHAALRAYIMGERGADHEEDPTPEEIAAMADHVRDSLRAGAMGFATSRTVNHRTAQGATIGTLTASQEELLGIGEALKETGLGVFQVVTDYRDIDFELGLIKRIASECGRPLSMGVVQAGADPDRWRIVLKIIEDAAAEGIDMKAQIATRAIGVLTGLDASVHPFLQTPSYQEIIDLPLPERVAKMRNPELRARMVSEFGRAHGNPMLSRLTKALDRLYRLGDPPNYEPDPAQSIAAIAEREGQDPVDAVYEALLEQDGKALLYFPMSNYMESNLEPSREMALSERTLFSLSDGGAHVGAICDASMPTSNITLWTRDRTRGPQLPLEFIVKRQTHDTARHVGWHDRGVLAPGYRADLNVIDFDALRLRSPHMVYDLPGGGKRLLQEAVGYRWTIKSGAVTFEDGVHTGELPGRLVRGAQPAPA